MSRRSTPPHGLLVAIVTGEIQLADGTGMLMPGDNGVIAVALDKPVAIDVGTHFAMREGGRTVGSGVVTQVRN